MYRGWDVWKLAVFLTTRSARTELEAARRRTARPEQGCDRAPDGGVLDDVRRSALHAQAGAEPWSRVRNAWGRTGEVRIGRSPRSDGRHPFAHARRGEARAATRRRCRAPVLRRGHGARAAPFAY